MPQPSSRPQWHSSYLVQAGTLALAGAPTLLVD
jgi:hypothetical protein